MATRRLRLMPDYSCYPLWNVTPGRPDDQEYNVDPRSLPLSDDLIARLDAWAERFDAILDPDDPASSAFAGPADEQEFIATGRALARELQRELGAAWRVSYFYDLPRRTVTIEGREYPVAFEEDDDGQGGPLSQPAT